MLSISAGEQQGYGNQHTASQGRGDSIRVAAVILRVMVEEALAIDPEALSSHPILAKLKEFKERNVILTTWTLQ